MSSSSTTCIRTRQARLQSIRRACCSTSSAPRRSTRVYAQDEIKLARWLIVNAGLRYDGYEQFPRVTPRAALIVLPSSTQSFKYLYGSAFRAPNDYELNTFYFGERVNDLRPESIDTHELVWERYINDWLRTSVSAYWYKADRLITSIDDSARVLQVDLRQPGPGAGEGARARSPDAPAGRTRARCSATPSRTRSIRRPERDCPIRRVTWCRDDSASAGRCHGRPCRSRLVPEPRQTVSGDRLSPAATTVNLTMLQPIGRVWQLFGTVSNIFDDEYPDPASSPPTSAGHSAERPDRPHRPALAALVAVTDGRPASGSDRLPPARAGSVPCRHAVAVFPRPCPGRRSRARSTRATVCATRSTATSGTSCRPRTIRRSSRSTPTIPYSVHLGVLNNQDHLVATARMVRRSSLGYPLLLHCAIDDGRTLRDEAQTATVIEMSRWPSAAITTGARGTSFYSLQGPDPRKAGEQAERRRRDCDGACTRPLYQASKRRGCTTG